MKAHPLGPLRVPRLGLGCMAMSEYYGPTDEPEALATLALAYDLGVRHFDTADAYGRGTNEELLAKFRAGRELVIATKFGLDRRDHFHDRYVNGTPEYARKACEASLRRLRTETIDLWYLHRVDPLVPIEETVGAMARLVEEGKVRAIGLSEVSARVLRAAHAVHPVAAVQSEYSLWSTEVETEILPACRELGVKLVAYSPLGKGFLSGKISAGAQLAEGDYRKTLPRFQGENLEKNLELLKPLQEIAAAHGCTPAQVALAWVLTQGDDVFVIPGTKKRGQLAENVAAASLTLAPAETARLAEHFRAHRPAGERYGDAAMATIRKGY